MSAENAARASAVAYVVRGVKLSADLREVGILTPRTTYATALARAAFSADMELVQLLLSYGADPNMVSSHNETALMQAAGYAWIDGYSRGKSNADRLQVIKLLVELGANVNAADDMGITALMAAGHLGDP